MSDIKGAALTERNIIVGTVNEKQNLSGTLDTGGNGGVSPEVTVTQIEGGHSISIKDINGTKVFDVMDGAAGPKGDTGAKGDKGDKGDTGATGPQGIQGEPGVKGDTGSQGPQGVQGPKGDKGDTGATGESGTSVTVKSVSESTADGGSNVVTFSDGKTITIKNGSKGSTGATGSAGKDGAAGVGVYSVAQTTTSSADGGSNVVTVTLTNGTTSTFTVKNGSKGSAGATGATGATGTAGKTPVRGTDYWTEADKAEIVAMVIESLGGNPIFGIVDESNNIVVSGDLPDGTYSVKYEMENGTKLNIGNLVLDTNVYYTVTNSLTQCTNSNSATKVVQGSAYSATITAKSGYELKSVTATMGGTAVSVSNGKINIASVTGNIVITAVAEEIVANYTNLFVPAQATLNNRLNSSCAVTAHDGYVITNFINVKGKTPFTDSTKIYMKGATLNDDGKSRIFTYKTNGTDYENSYTMTNKNTVAITDEGNGVISISKLASSFASGVVRAVMCLKVKDTALTTADLQNIVITIDEPIA